MWFSFAQRGDDALLGAVTWWVEEDGFGSFGGVELCDEVGGDGACHEAGVGCGFGGAVVFCGFDGVAFDVDAEGVSVEGGEEVCEEAVAAVEVEQGCVWGGLEEGL